MEFVIVPLVALAISCLTLLSGFGLGTLLMPAFAFIFPLDAAIALAAVVSLSTKLFKLAPIGKQADRKSVVRFGIPAFLAAMAGAAALSWISFFPPWLTYDLGDRTFTITPLKTLIGFLTVGFALMEVAPRLHGLAFAPRLLPLGGVMSGFLGGLSGHQGLLRTAFLLRTGLSKEGFLATGIFIACIVDISRLIVYAGHFALKGFQGNKWLLLYAILSGILGTLLGRGLLGRATFRTMQIVASWLLGLIGMMLLLGLI